MGKQISWNPSRKRTRGGSFATNYIRPLRSLQAFSENSPFEERSFVLVGASASGDFADQRSQFLEAYGLGQVSIEPRGAAFGDVVFHAVAGHGDGGGLRRLADL